MTATTHHDDDADSILTGAVRQAFGATCTHDAVQAAERDGWAPRVWDHAADMGLPWIGLPESAGGSGGTLRDALAVLRLVGEFAAPIPLPETGILGGWLAAGAGHPLDTDPLTVVPRRAEDSLRLNGNRVSGTAHRVPWARAVSSVVALLVVGNERPVVAVLPTAAMRIEHATNLAGEPRDTIHLDGVEPTFAGPAADGVDAAALRYRGALSRVALMAGALDRMSTMTQRYTGDRHQFGKPIGSFQAVQQHLVVGAQDAAIVGMAAAVAARETGHFEIAAAKILANDAAGTATRAAHQAHGAMGMTQEYGLHQFSRRLWSWRNEYGTSAFWRRMLGQVIAARGPDGLYPLITGSI